ncbi:MAG: RNA polymerase sigma-70 factor [Bacteroidota bacterium]|nr:RNA polymerase sigma-70 factor [Bacteroidota bacterium]
MEERKMISYNKLDEVSFEHLFRSYFSSLCLFGMKYLKDMDTAKEIVHDVFVNVWSKRNELDLDKSLKTYLFSSVYNRSLNYIRDHKKFKGIDEFRPEQYEQSSFDVSVELEGKELQSQIQKVIDSLPERTRKIFVMNRFEGFKYKEIADELKISQKTVEAQISSALKVLREKLKIYLEIAILLWITFFSN